MLEAHGRRRMAEGARQEAQGKAHGWKRMAGSAWQEAHGWERMAGSAWLKNFATKSLSIRAVPKTRFKKYDANNYICPL
jgi:hypothetical protein